MARPKTKDELIVVAQNKFDKLWQLIDSMTDEALKVEFDFAGDLSKKEAHWRRDKNLRDILIHLYEWHHLLLNWVNSNMSGNESHFLPEGYSWKTYGDLNIEYWKKHQDTQLQKAKVMLMTSHNDVLELVKNFTNEELFTKKYFNWTGSTSLGCYCVSSMPSHYDWAMKKLRAHIKKLT